MRLWTLHPKYLDCKGLVAAWREGLLAQKVLEGGTRGYTKHPQLIRFREHASPVGAVATFLTAIVEEAGTRGYTFDGTKINASRITDQMEETSGQLMYEWLHLLVKLKKRDLERYRRFCDIPTPDPNPVFQIVPGEIRSWEKTDVDSNGDVIMPGATTKSNKKSQGTSKKSDDNGASENGFILMNEKRRQTRTSAEVANKGGEGTTKKRKMSQDVSSVSDSGNDGVRQSRSARASVQVSSEVTKGSMKRRKLSHNDASSGIDSGDGDSVHLSRSRRSTQKVVAEGSGETEVRGRTSGTRNSSGIRKSSEHSTGNKGMQKTRKSEDSAKKQLLEKKAVPRDRQSQQQNAPSQPKQQNAPSQPKAVTLGERKRGQKSK